jgi:hypothetical protein
MVVFTSRLKGSVDGRSTDAKCPGDFGWAHAFSFELLHLSGINRHWTALVDAGSLCLRDIFHLPLFAQVGLKLRKHPKHVQEVVALTGALGANYLVAALGSVTAVFSLSFTVRGSIRNDDK